MDRDVASWVEGRATLTRDCGSAKIGHPLETRSRRLFLSLVERPDMKSGRTDAVAGWPAHAAEGGRTGEGARPMPPRRSRGDRGERTSEARSRRGAGPAIPLALTTTLVLVLVLAAISPVS